MTRLRHFRPQYCRKVLKHVLKSSFLFPCCKEVAHDKSVLCKSALMQLLLLMVGILLFGSSLKELSSP